MKLSVYFTPLGLKAAEISDTPVVVLDVLRTSTTIITALANGARTVLPAESSDEALTLANNLERDGVLLAGERHTHPIQGFDLGNSPLEMTRDVVEGKTLVMATTNGTPALRKTDPANPVLVAGIVNFTAAAETARAAFEETGNLVLLCAGREGMFALEDAYVAGRIAQHVLAGRPKAAVELNDAALASSELVRRYGDRWKRAVQVSRAAQDLKQENRREDIVAATDVDAYDIVPIYTDRLVKLPG